MRPILLFASLLLFSPGCGTAVSPAASPTSAAYHITTSRPADTVTAVSGEAEVVFDIFSPSGIGRAEISQSDGRWPERIELRLHLRGLESLTVTYGDVVVQTAVSSTGDHTIRQTVELPRQTAPVPAQDTPYETTLDIVAVTGQASIPLEDGYFALRLPLDFHEGAHTSFAVDWIDFYR